MNKKKLENRMGLLIFIIFVLHFVATYFYWYYSIFWFDMLMHFLGGCFLLLLIAYVFPPKDSGPQPILFLLLGLIFIGIAWEIFQFVFKNVIGGETFDIIDSISDIFFDALGGLSALFYFVKRIMVLDQSKV